MVRCEEKINLADWLKGEAPELKRAGKRSLVRNGKSKIQTLFSSSYCNLTEKSL